MKSVLVRYGEIGNKSRVVRNKMENILRQRVEDKLKYENISFDKVSSKPGRIIVTKTETKKAAERISEIPGVASTSPAEKTDPTISSIKETSKSFNYGESFGIAANRAGSHDFNTSDIKNKVGSFIQGFTDSKVDLDNPETLLEIDVREENAYLFVERYQGSDGLPVGTQGKLAALISGGIDSPVASYEMMKRGSDIIPIYFYNKPISAEDHLLRFEESVKKLKQFHPGKQWEYVQVDFEEVNQKLMDIERGRMILHRALMFRTAEKIANKEGLQGLVSGESLGQKSSQTAHNLKLTSQEVDMPVHRPLLGWNKNDIIEVSKEIGTFEESTISSACRSISPSNPAIKLKENDFENLKEELEMEELPEAALESYKKVVI